jgi:hypothetical protein
MDKYYLRVQIAIDNLYLYLRLKNTKIKEMRKYFTIAIMALSINAVAQNTCNIISSATLTSNEAIPHDNHYIGVGYTANNKALISDTSAWHYVVVTKAANLQTQTYVDGQLIIDTLFQNLSFSYSSLYIGAGYLASFSSFFNGYIDEFRMSNTIRSAQEIQSYFQTNLPFTVDANTIGLWHFDESSGSSFANSASATNGILTNNPQFTSGKFGNAIYFNGSNQYGNCNLNIPENNITFEFWFKSNSSVSGTIIQAYGTYNTGIGYEVINVPAVPVLWSTGETTPNITINPSTNQMVWVNNGICTDTIYFNNSYTTIFDTVLVSVTDTLIINTLVTGVNPPNNSNTILIYPNPANSHITIEYGDYTLMNGYQLMIENSLGQEVFITNINQQSDYLNLSSWGGNGLYFVHIVDQQGNTIDIKKIVLQ